MDALARGLRNAARMIEGGEIDTMRKERYSSYEEERVGRLGGI
jgi:xylose isomerase